MTRYTVYARWAAGFELVSQDARVFYPRKVGGRRHDQPLRLDEARDLAQTADEHLVPLPEQGAGSLDDIDFRCAHRRQSGGAG